MARPGTFAKRRRWSGWAGGVMAAWLAVKLMAAVAADSGPLFDAYDGRRGEDRTERERREAVAETLRESRSAARGSGAAARSRRARVRLLGQEPPEPPPPAEASPAPVARARGTNGAPAAVEAPPAEARDERGAGGHQELESEPTREDN